MLSLQCFGIAIASLICICIGIGVRVAYYFISPRSEVQKRDDCEVVDDESTGLTTKGQK